MMSWLSWQSLKLSREIAGTSAKKMMRKISSQLLDKERNGAFFHKIQIAKVFERVTGYGISFSRRPTFQKCGEPARNLRQKGLREPQQHVCFERGSRFLLPWSNVILGLVIINHSMNW